MNKKEELTSGNEIETILSLSSRSEEEKIGL